MPNGINTISPSIRDFLLSRNLILSDTITNNGLSGLASGLGHEAQVSLYPENVVASNDIQAEGVFYRDLNIINNPYASSNGDEVISIQNVPFAGNIPANTPQTEYPNVIGSELTDSKFTTKSNEGRSQMLRNQYQPNENDQVQVNIEYKAGPWTPSTGGYIDNNNNLNVGGMSTTGLDYIGGILGGDYIGLDGKPAFDVRSSLAGRVLGGAGIINDTPLGIIGGQQLLISLGNKALFNAQRETLGQINLNPLSILSGNDIIIPNYSITVGKDTLSKVVDTAINIAGFESPTSYLFDVSSSIFNRENPVSTKSRVDSQVANTGKGQVLALFGNLKANKYRLGVQDKRTGDDGVNPYLYIFSDGNGGLIDMLNANSDDAVNVPVSPSSYKMDAMVKDAGFSSLKGLKIDEVIEGDGPSDFIWTDTTINSIQQTGEGGAVLAGSQATSVVFDSKTLLGKTQALFKSNRMKVMLSAHGDQVDGTSEIETTAHVGGTQFISKGSGVLSSAAINGTSGIDPRDVFCRTWSSLDKYNQVNDLQKHSGLGKNFGLRNRNTTELSVLDDNGFVRIAPNIGDDQLNGDIPVNIKRFMFSLENLAWADDYTNLPASERGIGDPVTGTRGRIMWFPPYELNFTDTTSVNWDSHSFIGRGEPLYTYNNSERSGTLSFKVIIDHAAYMNDMRGLSNNDLFASIASGCYEFDIDKLKNLTKNEQDVIDCENVVTPDNIQDVPQTPPNEFTIYFANDVSTLDTPHGYEANGNKETPPVGCGITVSQGYTSQLGQPYEDRWDYGLNKEYLDPAFVSKLRDHMTNKCPACRINLGGYASTDGTTDSNRRLSNDRASNVRKWFLDNILVEDNAPEKRFKLVEGKGTTGCAKDSAPVDGFCKKEARRVNISFTYDPAINEANVKAQKKKNEEERARRELNNAIKSRFFNESLYFQKLEQENKVVFDSLGEKIKYFHPAFHSITPEGFNARLNFLQQCTRQGPTKEGDGPNNLAFGMAPVLILRIGDFYHTKIVMENLDIDFDSGTGVQWDLNPEGVGVQPMIANVHMSFKFIGGHSLNGPINKLQNAVSFNFFANTEVYDPRADYIQFKKDNDVSKGAQYMNDLDKGNLFAILNTGPDGTVINKPSTNQVSVAETANAESTASSTTGSSGSGDTAPQLLGFEMIEANGIVDSITAHSIEFKLKSLNATTNENIKKLADKGVKVKLTEANTGILILEEVLKYNSGSSTNLKFLNDALSFRYIMGTITPQGARIEGIAKGNYNLTLTHNGKTIQTQTIELGKTGGFLKHY